MTKACAHKPPADLLMMHGVADAAAREARGEQQGLCPHCGKWLWPDVFNTRTDYLEAMDAADCFALAIAEDERRPPRRR